MGAVTGLILASASASRRSMLENAGLSFACMPADVDERAIEERARREGLKTEHIASLLAAEKALYIAQQNPENLVIGADQILVCEGGLLSKAVSAEDAVSKLKFLSGKTHELISAVCVARKDKILWQTSDTARLKMHAVNEDFIRRYAEKAQGALIRSVGAYELEREGSWLFERVEGDFFTVLGLPLLPLLTYLHAEHGMGP